MQDPETFLTNIDPEDEQIILEAAQDTGFPIFIKKKAYSASGKLLPDLISVHSTIKGQDHGKFWDRVRELEKRRNMKPVFIVLKNADFTEGRGPMRFHSVWGNWEDADHYVMNQCGIFGSPQYLDKRLSKPSEGRWSYNGYDITQTYLIENSEEAKLIFKN